MPTARSVTWVLTPTALEPTQMRDATMKTTKIILTGLLGLSFSLQVAALASDVQDQKPKHKSLLDKARIVVVDTAKLPINCVALPIVLPAFCDGFGGKSMTFKDKLVNYTVMPVAGLIEAP